MSSFYEPQHYKYESTTLQISSYHRKVKVTLPLDVEMHELFDAFKTLVMSLGFEESTFDASMSDWMETSGFVERQKEREKLNRCHCDQHRTMPFNEALDKWREKYGPFPDDENLSADESPEAENQVSAVDFLSDHLIPLNGVHIDSLKPQDMAQFVESESDALSHP